MIAIERKKLEQVLEALYDEESVDKAIAAIKEALAQPEQEPVEDVVAYHSDGTRTVRIAPKRPWVGLTDEEIVELHYEIKVRLMGTYKTEDIYRAIEDKLKEKNNG